MKKLVDLPQPPKFKMDVSGKVHVPKSGAKHISSAVSTRVAKEMKSAGVIKAPRNPIKNLGGYAHKPKKV